MRSVQIVQTAKDTGECLTAGAALDLKTSPQPIADLLHVDASERFPMREGFGGAFTELAAVSDALETTAFINPDGRIAVIILNRTAQAVPYELRFEGQSGALEVRLIRLRRF